MEMMWNLRLNLMNLIQTESLLTLFIKIKYYYNNNYDDDDDAPRIRNLCSRNSGMPFLTPFMRNIMNSTFNQSLS
jgi:hypothetical protein